MDPVIKEQLVSLFLLIVVPLLFLTVIVLLINLKKRVGRIEDQLDRLLKERDE